MLDPSGGLCGPFSRAFHLRSAELQKKPGEGRGLDQRMREIAFYLLCILLGVLVLAAVTTEKPSYILVLIVLSLVWLGRKSRLLAEGLRSRDWLSIEGTIVAAQLWQYRSVRYAARISAPYLQYRYEVAGKVYESGPVVFGKTGRPAEILKPYPHGKAITVYYNPRHPERARLRRGTSTWDYLGLLLPLAMLMGSIALLCK